LVVFAGNTSKGQTWYFTIEPFDGSEYGQLKSSSLITIINTVPTTSNLAVTPSSPVTGNTLIANYTWADNDTTDLELGTEIIWFKDGILQGSLNNSLIVGASYTMEGQKWYFQVRPSDGEDYGAWVSCSANVTIVNTAPSANNLVLTPSDAKTGNDLSATYSWLDNDTLDSQSGTEIRWYKDGTLQPALNDSLVILAGNTSKGEVWHFQVHPSDGESFGSWISCPINITIENTLPSAINLILSPSTPKTGNTLTATYTWVDADSSAGDVESGSRIRWYKNGVLQPFLNDTLVVFAGNTTKGETWYFTIEPSDGSSYGQLRASSPITIINTAPTVSGIR
jgi:hypothetical protein